ncbi:MAG: quinone-dependent dihydroorotate dehydrogenase [Gammaproteobacteria bacterium]|nr:quinone-dependent dihydroorotate dehydrogenase [Gammaproteobacteria bacterium]
MLYNVIRSVLFRFDAEKSHNMALKALNLFASAGLLKLLFKPVINAPVTVMGLEFKNKVGLAAGLDKNARYIDALSQCGFGFIEVGTVTPVAQPGNDKPRLFRLPEASAIINRMGFNNEGVDQLIAAVKKSSYDGVIGINIGKNFSTAVENAVDDYLICFAAVHAIADYVTINISSPNTPGLRSLQHGEALQQLLSQLKLKQKELQSQSGRYVPLAVKIAPDLTEDEIKELAETFLNTEIDAVIATNTTFSRAGVEDLQYADEQGGLSGKPVMQSSTEVVRQFCQLFDNKIPVIAVGGIMSAEDALEKMAAGAQLVQIYSGFIYKGPELVYQCARALADNQSR